MKHENITEAIESHVNAAPDTKERLWAIHSNTCWMLHGFRPWIDYEEPRSAITQQTAEMIAAAVVDPIETVRLFATDWDAFRFGPDELVWGDWGNEDFKSAAEGQQEAARRIVWTRGYLAAMEDMNNKLTNGGAK